MIYEYNFAYFIWNINSFDDFRSLHIKDTQHAFLCGCLQADQELEAVTIEVLCHTGHRHSVVLQNGTKAPGRHTISRAQIDHFQRGATHQPAIPAIYVSKHSQIQQF